MLTKDREWKRWSLENILERAKAAGLSRSDPSWRWTIGSVWDRRSKLEAGEELINASRLGLFKRSIVEGIEKSKIPRAQRPRVDGIRAVIVDDDPWNNDFNSLTIDINFGDFVVPISIDAEYFAQHSSIPPTYLTSEIMLWVCEAHKERKKIRNVAIPFYEQVEAARKEIGAGFLPLRLQMRPKVCHTYDCWPEDPEFELITLELGSQLLPRLSIERLCNGTSFDFDMTAEIIRKRLTRKAHLERIVSVGLVSDIALALAVEEGRCVRELFDSARRVPGNAASVVVCGYLDVRNQYFCDGGVLYSSFCNEQSRHEKDTLSVHGAFPSVLDAAAVGRPLSQIVEYRPFELTGAVITSSRVGEHKVDFVYDMWAVPIEDVIRHGAEDALRTLRELRRNTGDHVEERSLKRFRWLQLSEKDSAA